MSNTEKDEDLRNLLQVKEEPAQESARLAKVVRRARAQVGQRDTLMFALVRFWTTLARLLAPLFAQMAEAQAKASGSVRPQKPLSTKT